MKIRIQEKITGFVGMTDMIEGVSINPVSVREANLLRACFTGVEILEDDGETVDQGLQELFEILPLDFYESSGNPAPSKFLPRMDGTYASIVEVAGVTAGDEVEGEGEQTQTNETPADEPKAATNPRFTEEELVAIADEKGIAGLRELATPLGLKGTSIATLMALLKSVEKE